MTILRLVCEAYAIKNRKQFVCSWFENGCSSTIMVIEK